MSNHEFRYAAAEFIQQLDSRLIIPIATAGHRPSPSSPVEDAPIRATRPPHGVLQKGSQSEHY